MFILASTRYPGPNRWTYGHRVLVSNSRATGAHVSRVTRAKRRRFRSLGKWKIVFVFSLYCPRTMTRDNWMPFFPADKSCVSAFVSVVYRDEQIEPPSPPRHVSDRTARRVEWVYSCSSAENKKKNVNFLFGFYIIFYAVFLGVENHNRHFYRRNLSFIFERPRMFGEHTRYASHTHLLFHF